MTRNAAMSGGGNRSGPGVSPARNGSKWIRPKRRQALYTRDGRRCVYCDRSEKDQMLTLDHVNGHSNCSSNLVTCCLSCNSAKQNLSPRKWYRLLRQRLNLTVRDTKKIQSKIYRKMSVS